MNQKFETFLNDLGMLNISDEKRNKEIILYMRKVETFYTDEIAKLKKKYRKEIKQAVTNFNSRRIIEWKPELLEVFEQAVELTREKVY